MRLDRLRELLESESISIGKIPTRTYSDPSFIPIHFTGGIGDGIILLDTIQRLKDEGYAFATYSDHADALNYFYKDIQFINKGSIPNFTWHLELDSVARFKFSPHFSGFLIPEHRELFERQIKRFKEHKGLEYLVNKHPMHKYALAALDVQVRELPLYCLGFDKISPAILNPRAEHRSYITFHDGYDVSNLGPDGSTKQWPIYNWIKLGRFLKREFPDYKIIQIGSKTARDIESVDINLVNKTTITEAFDILKRSMLHIDTDSGMVHAATEMGVPTIALFGPTPRNFYGHPQNVNLSSDTCVTGCFFITKDWMSKCPIGFKQPPCMAGIEPEQVLAEAIKLLK